MTVTDFLTRPLNFDYFLEFRGSLIRRTFKCTECFNNVRQLRSSWNGSLDQYLIIIRIELDPKYPLLFF